MKYLLLFLFILASCSSPIKEDPKNDYFDIFGTYSIYNGEQFYIATKDTYEKLYSNQKDKLILSSNLNSSEIFVSVPGETIHSLKYVSTCPRTGAFLYEDNNDPKLQPIMIHLNCRGVQMQIGEITVFGVRNK